jgi:hypothetical protein
MIIMFRRWDPARSCSQRESASLPAIPGGGAGGLSTPAGCGAPHTAWRSHRASSACRAWVGSAIISSTQATRVMMTMILRVRVEIMGSQNCRIVGKSQLVLLIMINPIIFTRTRS